MCVEYGQGCFCFFIPSPIACDIILGVYVGLSIRMHITRGGKWYIMRLFNIKCVILLKGNYFTIIVFIVWFTIL